MVDANNTIPSHLKPLQECHRFITFKFFIANRELCFIGDSIGVSFLFLLATFSIRRPSVDDFFYCVINSYLILETFIIAPFIICILSCSFFSLYFFLDDPIYSNSSISSSPFYYRFFCSTKYMYVYLFIFLSSL